MEAKGSRRHRSGRAVWMEAAKRTLGAESMSRENLAGAEVTRIGQLKMKWQSFGRRLDREMAVISGAYARGHVRHWM